MKKIFKNYKMTFILLLSMIIGLLIGIIFKERATILNPLGTLFINLLSTIIIPLIFVTISTSIAKINPKIALKLLKNIIITFIFMSLIAVFTGIIFTSITPLVSKNNSIILNSTNTTLDKTNFLERAVNMISVTDFNGLLTKENMIAVMVIAIIVGLALYKLKDKGKPVIKMLDATNNVLMEVLNIIMYYAPIGIMAFFASMVGTLGASIATDYIKVFIYYSIVAIIFALLFYSFIAIICRKNLKTFWKESIPVILCSLSTCSSASCFPINIKCSKKMGISDKVANTTISLGTSFHKDGSIIDSVFKIMFLIYLFNTPVSIFKIIGIALLSSLLISAVPIGGGTISEMCILTLLGFPISALPILTIIATITDAPATMLNSLGDTGACLLVDTLMTNDKKIT